MRNYQNAFYEPKLSNSENVESWEEAGAEDMRLRAFNVGMFFWSSMERHH